MQTSVKHITTLVLNNDEAQWLHNAMQNPLYGQHVFDEDYHDKDMRQRFFSATEVGVYHAG